VQPVVEILMATYNGQPYVGRQIESIIAQRYPYWRLVIHDDGSSDGTQDILETYRSQYPDRIVVLSDPSQFGSARDNFGYLMSKASLDYVMFCDQDDVWLDTKIADTLQAMQEAERSCGTLTPLAVFTDLTVVDDQLKVIAPSLWSFQRIRPEQADSLSTLAVRNCVTGCTMMMNRAGLQAALPVGAVAVMHDWWCALSILAAGGRVVPVRQATMLYRQHGGNVVGARRWGLGMIAAKLLQGRAYWHATVENYRMAKHFVPELSPLSFAKAKLQALF
jgi:glycosyltransferase involved in cell wall biosynthesis